ncbi:hypothetical protein QJS66_14165 [Kocuria rhizophila]|nr:hypothetical protein QJS66_14165 [Kocuria rhizophila]
MNKYFNGVTLAYTTVYTGGVTAGRDHVPAPGPEVRGPMTMSPPRVLLRGQLVLVNGNASRLGPVTMVGWSLQAARPQWPRRLPWGRNAREHRDRVLAVLREVFGYDAFAGVSAGGHHRPGEVGGDARGCSCPPAAAVDHSATSPTILREGTGVVVSPLIASVADRWPRWNRRSAEHS